MNERKDMSEHWEEQINDLLDGELAPGEVEALKREAESNAELAAAIIDAYALQAKLDELEVERAPDSLRMRLADIPAGAKKQPTRWFGMPRWVPAGAMAAIPLLVVAMVMMQPESPQQSEQQVVQQDFTEAEILQAHQDLATAFAYLDRINNRTSRHIESELADELGTSVTSNVSRHMPYANTAQQEENS